MIYFLNNKHKTGFTLIELLVSSSIFLIVVILGITSLIGMNRAYKITQYKKQQFDTLNAVMEDMVRNIRTATHIRCDINGDYEALIIETPHDCVNGDFANDQPAHYRIALEGVDGIEGDPDDQIVYALYPDSDNVWGLYKSVDGDDSYGGTFVRLTPPEIDLSEVNSGFSVLYSENPNDTLQPFVAIRLSGTITWQNDPTTFNIQTSVTPRTPEL